MTRSVIRFGLSTALVCLTAALASAQTSSTTTATKAFNVIAVDGNKLVVKLPEGTKELTVPDDFRFTVDGKQMSVHELKAGMNGTATITTRVTETPVTVTEVKSGVVVKTMGTSIIVRTDEGVKMFSQSDLDKRGIKIVKDGKVGDIFSLRENDRITATIVTAMPPKVMTEQQVQATLAAAPAAKAATGSTASSGAAAPKKGGSASASATAGGGAASASASPKPATLPKTATLMPLLGFMGMTSLLTGLGLTARRRFAR